MAQRICSQNTRTKPLNHLWTALAKSILLECFHSGIFVVSSHCTLTLYPAKCAKYCDQCVSTLYVCQFVCLLAYLKSHVSKFHQIFCVTRGPVRYALLVLWMMSSFHIMVGIYRIKYDTYVLSSSPDGSTGGEVCRHKLHLVLRRDFITGPPTHSVEGQHCFALWHPLSSSSVFCNTPRRACRWLHPCRPGDDVMPHSI